MLIQGKTVRHAGNVITDVAFSVSRFNFPRNFIGKDLGVAKICFKQVIEDPPCLVGHALNPVMTVQILPQEFFELLVFLVNFQTKLGQFGFVMANFCNGVNIVFLQIGFGLYDEVSDQEVDDIFYGLADGNFLLL